jgi:hypothetical protein
MLASSPCPTPYWNTCPSAILPDPRTPGSPPPVCARHQPRASPTDHQDPCPPQPTTPQVLLSPSYTWDDQTLAPQTPHTYHDLPGSSSEWNNWSLAPLGQAPAWCKTAAFTSLPGAPPLRRAGPSSTGFPDNRSTRLPLEPPQEGYKCS